MSRCYSRDSRNPRFKINRWTFGRVRGFLSESASFRQKKGSARYGWASVILYSSGEVGESPLAGVCSGFPRLRHWPWEIRACCVERSSRAERTRRVRQTVPQESAEFQGSCAQAARAVCRRCRSGIDRSIDRSIAHTYIRMDEPTSRKLPNYTARKRRSSQGRKKNTQEREPVDRRVHNGRKCTAYASTSRFMHSGASPALFRHLTRRGFQRAFYSRERERGSFPSPPPAPL